MERKPNGQFAKGESGNPSGRPKTTDTERETLERISQLAPKAVSELSRIINSKKIRADIKLRAIEIVLSRVYGKETSCKNFIAEPVIIKW